MGLEMDPEWARTMASAQFAQLIAEAMAIPADRVRVELIPDIGIGRSVGVAVFFDPPMSRAESSLLRQVMPFVCIAAGVSEPREWAEA